MSVNLANAILDDIDRADYAHVKLLHRCCHKIPKETTITATGDEIGINLADRNMAGRCFRVKPGVEPANGLAQDGLVVRKLLQKTYLPAGRHNGHPIISDYPVFHKVK